MGKKISFYQILTPLQTLWVLEIWKELQPLEVLVPLISGKTRVLDRSMSFPGQEGLSSTTLWLWFAMPLWGYGCLMARNVSGNLVSTLTRWL